MTIRFVPDKIRQALLNQICTDKTHMRVWKLYILWDNFLHYKQFVNGETTLLLAVPRSLTSDILQAIHNICRKGSCRHIKNYVEVPKKNDWPIMMAYVVKYVKS